MQKEDEIQKFLTEPRLLAGLLDDIARSVGIFHDDMDGVEKQAQLREIIKTIVRLQSQGITIPESLIDERDRLLREIEVPVEAAEAIEPVVRDLLETIERIVERLPRAATPKSSGLFQRVARGKARLQELSQDSPLSFVLAPRESRKLTGMNQKEFWGRFGVTQSGGSRYEGGREIGGPTQILMMLYARNRINDDDLAEARAALGSTFRQSSE